MGITYEKAEDIEKKAREIVLTLNWDWIDLNNVGFIRSHGSASRGTIARCHAMGKAMQIALNRKGYYLIEVISKRFDNLSEEDKTRVIIHELMHIPKSFGGGFIHHNVVHERNVRNVYEHYCKLKIDKGDKASFTGSSTRDKASFTGSSTRDKASFTGSSTRGWF